MPLDLPRLRFLLGRCNPYDALPPDDDRYIPLDERRVRGIDWVARLAAPIERSEKPTCRTFTGLLGSGKSTELLRLAQRLTQKNFFVVLVDAEDTIDITATIDVPDVLLTILAATERKLVEAEGKDPDVAMEEGYLNRLWKWLQRIDVALTKVEFGIDKVVKFTTELKTRPNLRARVRATLGAHLHHFLAEVRDELRQMEARAVALKRDRLVVIVDSLEKLRGTSTTWDEVLESAERLFSDGAPYLCLPVHVLYTIPPALVSRKFIGQVDFMPMIKLRDAAGVRYEPGFDAAYEVISHRVPPLDLDAVFTPKTHARVERLIEASGGYPRELVRYLQQALLAEHFPLDDGDFGRLLHEVADQYRKLIPASAFPWLARIAVERYLTVDDADQRKTADSMLSNNVVMRYLNDRDWFDLHPSVRDIPGVAAAIARLRSPS